MGEQMSEGYQIVVLVKQVPDTAAVSSKAMKDDGTLNRAALPAVFNPEDMNGLEMALELKELYGATVSVITMGPPAAAEVLRQALYRGADRAVLLTDRRFAAADTLATSYVLAKAIEKTGRVDIVVCGRQAIDGNTAQTGPQVAEKLGINQLTYADKIVEISKGKISLWRIIEQGRELVQAELPVLLTVPESVNSPRPASVKKIMKYKKARAKSELSKKTEDANRADAGFVEEWNALDIGADPARCGISGSPTRVKKIEKVVLKGLGFKKIEPTDEAIKQLLQEFVETYVFD